MIDEDDDEDAQDTVEPLLRPCRLIQKPKFTGEKPACPSLAFARRTGRRPLSAVASRDGISGRRRTQRPKSLRRLPFYERQIRRYAL